MSEQVIDKHGESMEDGARVMVDGALVGTLSIDGDHISVDLDGSPGLPAKLRTESVTLRVPEVESLGDGVNQAMRAVRGQPS